MSSQEIERQEIQEGDLHLEEVMNIENYPVQESYKAKVINCDSLNLRSDASRDSNVLLVLKNGTVIDVIDVTPDGWAKITYNYKIGYVMEEFIEEV